MGNIKKGYEATFGEKMNKKWSERQEIFMNRTKCKGDKKNLLSVARRK